MAFTASQAFDLLRTAFSRNRLPHALLIVETSTREPPA